MEAMIWRNKVERAGRGDGGWEAERNDLDKMGVGREEERMNE